MKKIVSIQDISCYGQCSLTVALPVLSSRGIETAILPSGILSTHTGGFKNYTYHDLTDEMPRIVNHWISEGIKFDAIYTGYIGDKRQFDLIKTISSQLLNIDGKLIVDPAMADNGKLYSALDNSIVEGMKSIVSVADLILPNLTEAAFLLNKKYKEEYTREEIIEMAKALTDLGAKEVVVTGVKFNDDKIGALNYNSKTGNVSEYYSDKQPNSYHGTGDIFSSIYVAEYINGNPPVQCIESACEFVVKCIKKTREYPEHNYGVMFESVLKEERN